MHNKKASETMYTYIHTYVVMMNYVAMYYNGIGTRRTERAIAPPKFVEEPH